MLRLELRLVRPGVDDRAPPALELEMLARRDGGPDSPPVAVAPVLLTGDTARTGDMGLATRPLRPFRSSRVCLWRGHNQRQCFSSEQGVCRAGWGGRYAPSSTVSVSAL